MGGFFDRAPGLIRQVLEIDPANQGARWLLVSGSAGFGAPDSLEAGNAYLRRFDDDGASVNSIDFSPDGKWLAFTSNESGRREVYVRRFPDMSGFQSVSLDGGTTLSSRASR